MKITEEMTLPKEENTTKSSKELVIKTFQVGNNLEKQCTICEKYLEYFETSPYDEVKDVLELIEEG